MSNPHLHEELAANAARVTVTTRSGPVTGGRALNGAAVFLGTLRASSRAVSRSRRATAEPSIPRRYHFLGDPENITIQGLSAGAHSVHQFLHHASRLPKGSRAPFRSALLESNAIVWSLQIQERLRPSLTRYHRSHSLPPKTPTELRPQFDALCRALGLNPMSATIMESLRNVPASRICHVIETDAVGTEFGTYPSCVDDDWLAAQPDAMTWQRSGALAAGLKRVGVKSVVLGDTIEEWYLYSIAHPIKMPADIVPNLKRYYPADMVASMVKLYRTLPDDAGEAESARLYGEIAADYQVYLPGRLLARDLQNAGYPVLRYEFRWVPEQIRPQGYITHGTDQYIWHLRVPSLEPSQIEVAKRWSQCIDAERNMLEAAGVSRRPLTDVFALCEDLSMKWIKDQTWDYKMRLLSTLPGETSPATKLVPTITPQAQALGLGSADAVVRNSFLFALSQPRMY